jgi:hypothetical protein
MSLQSNGSTTALYIDTSQNVGIGTSSPSYKLSVTSSSSPVSIMQTTATASGYDFAFNNAPNANSGASILWHYGVAQSSNNCGIIQFNYTGGSGSSSNSLGLGVYNNNNIITLNGNGNMMLGTTSTNNYDTETGTLHIASGGNTNGRAVITFGASSTASQNWHMVMGDNSSSVNWYNANYGSGTIEVYFKTNGGIANYSGNNVNLSDERVKKNIQPAGNYLDKICAIPVKTFEYIDDKRNLDGETLGVIAQDVEKIAPELVDATGFGETPQDGVPLKSIYQTDLQYALMKAIQELKTIVDAQAAEITALKAKVGA